MALNIAIINLPNVGKSTTFNALILAQHAAAENYPFCTIEFVDIASSPIGATAGKEWIKSK